jgi:hypothetical protein
MQPQPLLLLLLLLLCLLQLPRPAASLDELKFAQVGAAGAARGGATAARG